MQPSRWQTRIVIDWSRLRQHMIYLPGAVILIYGFWLSLSV